MPIRDAVSLPSEASQLFTERDKIMRCYNPSCLEEIRINGLIKELESLRVKRFDNTYEMEKAARGIRTIETVLKALGNDLP